MAGMFANYEAIAKTESYDDENGAATPTSRTSGSRRYLGMFAALLAVVTNALHPVII